MFIKIRKLFYPLNMALRAPRIILMKKLFLFRRKRRRLDKKFFPPGTFFQADFGGHFP